MNISSFFSAWLLPPGLSLTLLILALSFFKRNARVARVLLVISGVSLYLFSSPFFASKLSSYLEGKPDKIVLGQDYKSVVCLTGGLNSNSPEYETGISPSSNTVVRCTFATMLAIEHSLPLVVSGGGLATVSEAKNFELYLNRLNTGVIIKVEEYSRNTSEAPIEIIRKYPDYKGHIILVTDASHLMRAKFVFEQAGFIVTGVPTNYSEFDTFSLFSFFPNIRAMDSTQRTLHELVGMLVLKIRNIF